MTIASQLRRFEPLLRHVRPLYRKTRTAYLRWRHPAGGYVRGTGIPVFVDFTSDTYAWYDADAPNLAFDRRILSVLAGQSSGNVFVDVGAHFGYYCGVFAELTRDRGPVKIVAIEPDRQNFACLQRTVAQYRHVTPVLLQVAAADVDGTLTLYRSSKAPCLHSFSEDASQQVYTVPAARLDSIVRDHLQPGEKIAVMKVDIDGAEAAFLRGAAETFVAHQPIAFIEFSPSNLRGAGADPRAFFTGLCDRFNVYYVSYAARTVRRVSPADYTQISAEVGEGISDLITSSSTLDFGKLHE